jgi:3-keto-5-aminohexanoate cleavage enzyme
MQKSAVIIEVAVNGGTKKDKNLNSPISPEEIAADALECIDAGASIIHQHDASGDGQQCAILGLQTYKIILGEQPDAICYPTIAFAGNTVEDAWNHNRALAEAGVLRMAFLDPGSLNLGRLENSGAPDAGEFVYANSNKNIRWIMEQCAQLKLAPSMAIFDASFLRNAVAYEKSGQLAQGAFAKLYFCDDHGPLSFGLWPTETALNAYLEMMSDSKIPWASAVLSGDLVDSGMAELTVKKGGHLRVGLEDFGGRASPCNRELVENAADLVESLGYTVATPAQTADILNLP